jgi:anti-sigma factor RsiW
MSARDYPIGEDDLQAFVDGRLPAERRRAVEAYLSDHASVAERVAAYRRQRDALRDRLRPDGEEPIPSRLRVASLLADRRRRNVGRLGAVAAAACWLGLGGVLGWYGSASLGRPAPPPAAAAADALLAHRTYVGEVRHAVEVGADEEAHLVRWLSNRLGHPLHVPDLAALGWRLMGGRLLPASAGPAAQFMYEDQGGRRLTLYVRADGAGGATAFRLVEQGDLGAFYWLDRGLSFAIAGATDRASLLAVAQAIDDQLDAPPSGGAR